MLLHHPRGRSVRPSGRLLAAASLLAAGLGHGVPAAAAASDCIEFGKPDPATTFVYRRVDSTGPATRYSHRWTEFTAERSSVSVQRGKVSEVVTNQHRIENDVTMIAATASKSSTGSHRTDYRPAVVGDPMFRACPGRTWRIPAVAATHTAGAQVTTASTYAGNMKIQALREMIVVPAGRFECVRYTRTLATPTGPSVDEYWKSIKHGVVVRQVSKLGSWTSTSELVAIQ